LVKLDLSKNHFFETGKALGDMLAVNTVLQELDLSMCSLGENAESVKAIAGGLAANGTPMCAGGDQPYTDVPRYLVDGIRRGTLGSAAVEQQMLHFTLEDVGKCCRCGQHRREHRTLGALTSLDLSHNDLACADALVDALSKNVVLGSLRASRNQFPSEQRAQLRTTMHGRTLHL